MIESVEELNARLSQALREMNTLRAEAEDLRTQVDDLEIDNRHLRRALALLHASANREKESLRP